MQVSFGDANASGSPASKRGQHRRGDSVSAITVVITTHNLEHHIDRCLQELFEQTMRDFDVLLVDDASTDGTAAMVEQWRERFGERLTTIYLEENLGCSALTRNVALESGKIRGDYVLFLDGDDSIERDMLAVLFAEAASSGTAPDGRGADVVVGAFDRRTSETGRAYSTEMRGFPKEIGLPPRDEAIAFINPSPWNKLWRREIIEGLRFPDIKVGEEIVFNFNAYARARNIRFTDKVLIHYMERADSAIAGTDAEDIRRFALELLAFHNAQTGLYRDLAAFLAFLHIGLSMALRAADNPGMDLRQHIAKVRNHFKCHYAMFKNNPFLKLSSLRKRKLKGMLIWLALLAYKCNLFHPVLLLYRKSGLHIKF